MHLLALLLPLALAPPQAEGLDHVVTKKGKEYDGVVLERYQPDGLVLLQGTRRKRFAHDDLAVVDAKRDRLASLLEKRVAGLELGEEWALAQAAASARLPHMARVLAWHVLTLDPEHDGAHELLGHQRRGERWRWPLGNKWVDQDDFEAGIRDWDDRLVLENEHWIIETNAGLRQAVDTAVDLERLYVAWMATFGEPLRAAEDVDRPDEEKPRLWIFRRREDRGFKNGRYATREPMYDPSRETTAEDGDTNLAWTFYDTDDYRPRDLFDLATRQLMYGLLVLSKNRGELPPDFPSMHAPWAEWGLGYWFGAQLGGTPGYAEHRPFELGSTVALDALENPRNSPLRLVREELTNLVGLQNEYYWARGRLSDIHRAKARAFFAYLMEVDPPLERRKKVVGSGREGVLFYLREVYGTPKAHSSSALDEGLGGAKVEQLGEAWRAWVEAQI